MLLGRAGTQVKRKIAHSFYTCRDMVDEVNGGRMFGADIFTAMPQTLLQLETTDGRLITVECTRKVIEDPKNPALHDQSRDSMQGRHTPTGSQRGTSPRPQEPHPGHDASVIGSIANGIIT